MATPGSNGSVTSHSAEEVGVVTGAEPPPMTQKERQEEREKITGYQFAVPSNKDKTPKDFARNPATGRTEGHAAVYGVQKIDLRSGVEDCNLPCQFIWKRGRWLSDFDPFDMPVYEIEPKPVGGHPKPASGWEWAIWVTHGEGSPGNWAFIAYLLPVEIAANPLAGQIPRHPLMWKKNLKSGKSGVFSAKTDEDWNTAPPQGRDKEWYQASWQLLNEGGLKKMLQRPGGVTYGHGYASKPWEDRTTKPGVLTPPATATPPKAATAAASALPATTRFRHKCGHWFKENELVGHSKVCPADQGDDADFAMFCDDKCGCELISGFPSENHALGHKTLDHVSRCKPGFPRTVKVEEVKVTDAAVADGETTQPDAPEAVPTEAAEPEEQVAIVS